VGAAETRPAARAVAAGRGAGFREAVFIAGARGAFTEVITQPGVNSPVERPIARRLRIGQEIAPPGQKEHERMPLLNLVVVLVVVGVALYLINRYIPMASSIKTILNIVVVVAVCIWLLQAVGLWDNVRSFRLGR
jgi:hypothetical protein